MSRHLRGYPGAAVCLLALLIVAAEPARAAAAWLGFRNDMKVPVVVQGATIQRIGQRNVLRRGKAVLLSPGDVSWEPILEAGNRYITVTEANPPGRGFYQGVVPVLGNDLFFSIQLEPPPPPAKGEKPLPPRVNLVPAKPPMPPPRPRMGR
jgi:hypothetical protein